jgi:transposase
MWVKRLEKHQFKWPNALEEMILVRHRQLEWLLAGLDYTSAHKQLKYSAVA